MTAVPGAKQPKQQQRTDPTLTFLDASSSSDFEPTNPFHQFLAAEAAVSASAGAAVVPAAERIGNNPLRLQRSKSGEVLSRVEGLQRSKSAEVPSGVEASPLLPLPSGENRSPTLVLTPPTPTAASIASAMHQLQDCDAVATDTANPFHAFLDAAVSEVADGQGHAVSDTQVAAITAGEAGPPIVVGTVADPQQYGLIDDLERGEPDQYGLLDDLEGAETVGGGGGQAGGSTVESEVCGGGGTEYQHIGPDGSPTSFNPDDQAAIAAAEGTCIQ
jgi:hypothetical protein